MKTHCHKVHHGFDHKDGNDVYQEMMEKEKKVTVDTSIGATAPPLIPEDGDEEMLDDELEMKIIRLLLAIKNGNYGQDPEEQMGNDMEKKDAEQLWAIGSAGGNAEKDENGKWQCPHCDRKYTKKGNLRRHIFNFHDPSGVKHECVCGAKFSQCSALKRHQLTHKKKKAFACGECTFATHWFQNLKRHMASHHPTL